MIAIQQQAIIDEYLRYLNNRAFPCIAAKAAVELQHVRCMVVGNMACPKDDAAMLQFLYEFIDAYRNITTPFHSAAIIFEGPSIHSEEEFDQLLWQRLQSISNLDAQQYSYDPRVNPDPSSGEFSFSLKSEALFIIGLHPLNSRHTRQFSYPAIVFNPHAEFQHLRATSRYEKMKEIVRKRDLAYSGSVNPMLDDFGNSSEVYQYSGRKYDASWQCPLKINHGATEHNSAP